MRIRRTTVLGLAAGGSLAVAGIAAAHGSPGGGKPTTTPPPPCRGNGHDPHGNGLGHGEGHGYGHCDGGHDDGHGSSVDGRGITLTWGGGSLGSGANGRSDD